MGSLILYKYRSLKNFQFIADTLVNNRFYAATFSELNDPMEGLFLYAMGIPGEICERRNYLEESSVLRLRETFSEISKMISGLKRGIGFSDRCES
jgi:hypothetical protein